MLSVCCHLLGLNIYTGTSPYDKMPCWWVVTPWVYATITFTYLYLEWDGTRATYYIGDDERVRYLKEVQEIEDRLHEASREG